VTPRALGKPASLTKKRIRNFMVVFIVRIYGKRDMSAHILEYQDPKSKLLSEFRRYEWVGSPNCGL
jgi:hypothetical protein